MRAFLIVLIALAACGDSKRRVQADSSPHFVGIGASEVADVSVIAIPESAFLKALEVSKTSVPSQRARDAGRKVAAFANEPSRRAFSFDEGYETNTSFSGELFLVVQGDRANPTGVYVAAAKLEGQTPWKSSVPSIARGAASQPLSCCGLEPGEYAEVCGKDDEGPLPGPCSTGFEFSSIETRTKFLEKARGANAVAFVDLGIDCVDTNAIGVGGKEIFCRMCQQVLCTETVEEGGNEQPPPSGCGKAVPEHCTMIMMLDQDHIPPECGGLCSDCEEQETCFGPTSGGCNMCLYVVDPSGGTCGNPDIQEAIKEAAAIVGCDGKANGDGVNCCGHSCGCSAGSGVCVQCNDDGSCVVVPDPTLVNTTLKPCWDPSVCDWDPTHTHPPVPPPVKLDLSEKEKPKKTKPKAEPKEKPEPEPLEVADFKTPDKATPSSPEAPPVKKAKKPAPADPWNPNDEPYLPTEEPHGEQVKNFTQPAITSNSIGSDTNNKPSKGLDPISHGDGSLVLNDVDLSFPGSGSSLSFVRHYSSRSAGRSALGSNWTHNYDVRIVPVKPGTAESWMPPSCNESAKDVGLLGASISRCLVLRQPTRHTLFYFDSISGVFLPQAGSTDTIRPRPSRQGWELRKKDGAIWQFNTYGYATELRDRFGNGVSIDYEFTPLYTVFKEYCQATFREGLKQPGLCEELAVTYNKKQAAPDRPKHFDNIVWHSPVANSADQNLRYYVEHLLANAKGTDVPYGDAYMRPTQIKDDLGRTLHFSYVWAGRIGDATAFNAVPHAGLLRSVKGPGGVILNFSYDRPTNYERQLNESFLTQVIREEPAQSAATSPLRNRPSPNYVQNYAYDWSVSDGHSSSVFDSFVAFFGTHMGCTSSGLPNLKQFQSFSRKHQPCVLAWKKRLSYISNVTDNIVSVSSNGRIDLETRYNSNPKNVDSFDRAVAQRFGGQDENNSSVLRDQWNNWKTSRALNTMRYVSAAPVKDEIDPHIGVLPEAIVTKYELENAPPEVGDGWDMASQDQCLSIAEAGSANYLPASCQADTRTNPSGGCSFQNASELEALLPGYRRTVPYYEAPHLLRLERLAQTQPRIRLRRTQLNCSQIARAQLSDRQHNDTMYQRENGALKVLTGGRERLTRDANRICGWAHEQEATGDSRWIGLNYRGQALVRAEKTATGFVFSEAVFNADGLLTEQRRVTASATPWKPSDGFTQLEYEEPDPNGSSGWNAWVPMWWARRANLLQVTVHPRGTTTLDEGHKPSVILAKQVRNTYEPLFNQLQRVEEGVVRRWRGTEVFEAQRVQQTDFDYQEFGSNSEVVVFLRQYLSGWGVHWASDYENADAVWDWQLPVHFYGTADTPSDLNGDGSSSTQGLPIRIWSGTPDASQSEMMFVSWSSHGQPAFIESASGAITSFEYWGALHSRGPPSLPKVPFFGQGKSPNEVDTSSPYNRGLLAKVTSYQYSAAQGFGFETVEQNSGCVKLKGPFRWLLEESCIDPNRELIALGLSATLSAFIVRSSQESHMVSDSTMWSYNKLGLPIRIWQNDAMSKLTYSSLGQLHRYEDPLGRVSEFVYDKWENLVSTMERTREGVYSRETQEYDDNDRLTKTCVALNAGGCVETSIGETNSDQLVAVFDWDLKDRLTNYRSHTDLQTQVNYGAFNLPTQIVERDGGTAQVEVFQYTLDNQLAGVALGSQETRAALGKRDRSYVYDGFGQLLSIGHINGSSERFFWDFQGNLSRKESYGRNPRKPLWKEHYKHDVFGRLYLRKTQDRFEERTTFAKGGAIATTDATGRGANLYATDAQGHLVWSRNPGGTQYIRVFDPSTNVEHTATITPTSTGASSINETTTFDSVGRAKSLVRSAADASQTWRVEYAANDSLRRSIDPLGFTSRFEHNWLGWRTKEEIQDSGEAGSSAPTDYEERKYTYAEGGRLRTAIDALGDKTVTKMDAFGRVVLRKFASQTSDERFQYNGFGELSHRRTPLGVKLQYQYQHGNLVRVEEDRGAALPILLLTRKYDKLGRSVEGAYYHYHHTSALPTKVERKTSFDVLGRVQVDSTKIASGPWRSARYSRTDGAETFVEKVVLPGGLLHERSYDSSERLSGVNSRKRQQRQSFRFRWQGDFLKQVNATLPSGKLSTRYDFDPLGRLAKLDYSSEGKPLLSIFEHQNQANATISEFVSRQGKPHSWRGFAFDPASRLSRIYSKSAVQPPQFERPFASASSVSSYAQSIGATERKYERNSIGSTTKIRNGSTIVQEAAFAGAGKLASFIDNGVELTIEYEAAGRVARIGNWEYQYDALGKLISEVDDTSANLFLYRDDGFIAGTRTNNGLTQYIFDRGQVVAAIGQNSWDIVWGNGIDIPLSYSSSRGTIPLLVDSRGTPLSADLKADGHRTFDENGRIGEITCGTKVALCTELEALPIKFGGLLALGDSGLLYARNRWYSPELGQFLTVDPKGLIDGMNVYAYAGMNPVNFRDPWGLDKKKGFIGHTKDFGSGVAKEIGDMLSGIGSMQRDFLTDLGNKTLGEKFAIASQGPSGLLGAYAEFMAKSALNAGRAIAADPEAALDSIVSPYTEAIEQGRPAEAIGRGTVAIVSMLVGTKGLDKVAKLTRLSKFTKKLPKKRPCNCFAEGTLVQTSEGLRPIEDIKVGDLVLAKDETTGDLAYKPVLETYVTPDRPLLTIQVSIDDGSVEELNTTPGHPFWVSGVGWEQAASLVKYGVLATARTSAEPLTHQAKSMKTPRGPPVEEGVGSVVETTSVGRYGTVYNLNVAEFHTYFVGETGVWVHNNSPCVVPKGGVNGGLNLFKWKDKTSNAASGWKEGDRFLRLPNRGSAAANWKQNSGVLRSEMRKGNPIYDSYRNASGQQIPTGGFLGAERKLLESRGWSFNPSTGAYHPPTP